MYVHVISMQGDEAPLTALLVIYQLHAPHFIPVTLKSQQKVYGLVICYGLFRNGLIILKKLYQQT